MDGKKRRIGIDAEYSINFNGSYRCTALQGNVEQPHPTAGVPDTLKRELGVH